MVFRVELLIYQGATVHYISPACVVQCSQSSCCLWSESAPNVYLNLDHIDSVRASIYWSYLDPPNTPQKLYFFLNTPQTYEVKHPFLWIHSPSGSRYWSVLRSSAPVAGRRGCSWPQMPSRKKPRRGLSRENGPEMCLFS